MNSSAQRLFSSCSRLPPSVLRMVFTVQPLPGSIGHSRRAMSSNINRPSPPPLPREQQREFEDLLRAAQAPLSVPNNSRGDAEADLTLHPDARKPLKADFEGDVNPVTGEEGGPKREPVGQWEGSDGDWSFKGRVTDF